MVNIYILIDSKIIGIGGDNDVVESKFYSPV